MNKATEAVGSLSRRLRLLAGGSCCVRACSGARLGRGDADCRAVRGGHALGRRVRRCHRRVHGVGSRSVRRGLRCARGRAAVAASVTEFAERFRERSGSLSCPDILGCDVRTPEGMKMAWEKDLFATTCSKAVRDACEILADMV